MSERMTAVSLPGHFGVGIADWGTHEPVKMIEELREYARHQLAEAQAVLAAADADFIVETYRGPHAQRDRQRIWPPAQAAEV